MTFMVWIYAVLTCIRTRPGFGGRQTLLLFRRWVTVNNRLWGVFTSELFMALRWELIFHSLSDFLCPLFSEKDKRRRPPPCSHSCVVTRAQTGPYSIDRRPQDSSSEPWKTPGRAPRHSSWLFPPPINHFFGRKWHVWVTHLLPDDDNLGCRVCWDVVLQRHSCSFVTHSNVAQCESKVLTSILSSLYSSSCFCLTETRCSNCCCLWVLAYYWKRQ